MSSRSVKGGETVIKKKKKKEEGEVSKCEEKRGYLSDPQNAEEL